MAGFREFQTGEVLTAANVDDYLAKQAVMKFADASARDTALGTAVGGSNALREGMVAWLDDTDTVIAYDGSGWATVGNAGIGTNVVQTVKTDTFTTSSTSFTDITGFSATITPTSATSKVLVLAYLAISNTSDLATAIRLDRDGTDTIFIGDAGAANQIRSTAGGRNTTLQENSITVVYVDSPATTSAVTYKVRLAAPGGGTAVMNRGGTDDNNANWSRTASSLTVIEVAA